MKPLRPLPEAMCDRMIDQQEGAFSWRKPDYWIARRVPFDVWPDEALIEFANETDFAFADWHEPTATELRRNLRASIHAQRRH